MRELLKSADHMLVGGHRGCRCPYPENSLKALQTGLERGADYLEIDIQLTKDDVPVVIHDLRLETKTDLNGYVHEYSLREIRDHISSLCTFQEAMEWGGMARGWFALELKTIPYDMSGVNRRLIPLMAEILKETKMVDRVFVFGPDYRMLRELKRLLPDIMLGLIVPFVPADPVRLMREMGAEIYLSYVWNMDRELAAVLKGAGCYLDGSVIPDQRWMRAARSLGVDMYETDLPGEKICL